MKLSTSHANVFLFGLIKQLHVCFFLFVQGYKYCWNLFKREHKNVHQILIFNIKLLIYLLAVTAGCRGMSCRAFFWVFFVTWVWDPYVAVAGAVIQLFAISVQPHVSNSHVFSLGAAGGFILTPPAAPGVRPFFSTSEVLHLSVSSLRQTGRCAWLSRNPTSVSCHCECCLFFFVLFFYPLSWGKFSTFSCNHSLIARDCRCREGLLFTCQLGVHCVRGSSRVLPNLCFLKSFESELCWRRRSTHVPSLVFSCSVLSGSFTLLN